MLGYPNVTVEITEDQFETIYRIAGDFIAEYFPREQKLAVFWTQPLKPTYPLPKDAYWVQQVSWDPVTSRIDDIFGAESFLFCVNTNMKILASDGSLQPVMDWRPHWRAKSPFGKTRLKYTNHKDKVKRGLELTKIGYANGYIEAYSNHVINANNNWLEFGEVSVGDMLNSVCGESKVTSIIKSEGVEPISIKAQDSGCYYGCVDGEPVLLH